MQQKFFVFTLILASALSLINISDDVKIKKAKEKSEESEEETLKVDPDLIKD